MKRTQILSFLAAVSVFFTLFSWQVVPVSATAAVEFDKGKDIEKAISLPTTKADPVNTTVGIINVALGLLSLVAVVIVIYAGFSWMLSGGSSEKIKKARDLLINAVIGLLIIMAAYGISKYVFEQLNKATTGAPAPTPAGSLAPQKEQRNV